MLTFVCLSVSLFRWHCLSYQGRGSVTGSRTDFFIKPAVAKAYRINGEDS